MSRDDNWAPCDVYGEWWAQGASVPSRCVEKVN